MPEPKYPLPELPTFTVATVPDATKFEGHIIYVSNGNAGARCIAVSNGTNWLVISLGSTAIAAA